MPRVAGGKGGKASAGDGLFAFSCGGRGLRLRHLGWVPAAARRSTPPRQELHLPAGCGRRARPVPCPAPGGPVCGPGSERGEVCAVPAPAASGKGGWVPDGVRGQLTGSRFA